MGILGDISRYVIQKGIDWAFNQIDSPQDNNVARIEIELQELREEVKRLTYGNERLSQQREQILEAILAGLQAKKKGIYLDNDAIVCDREGSTALRPSGLPSRQDDLMSGLYEEIEKNRQKPASSKRWFS